MELPEDIAVDVIAYLEDKERAGYTLSEVLDELTGRTANSLTQ